MGRLQCCRWMNISCLSGTLHASFLNWLLIGHFELTMDRTLLYPEGSKLFTMSLLNLPFSVVMGGVSKVRVFKVSGSRLWHQSSGFSTTMRRFPLNSSYRSSHFFRRIIGQSYFFKKVCKCLDSIIYGTISKIINTVASSQGVVSRQAPPKSSGNF